MISPVPAHVVIPSEQALDSRKLRAALEGLRPADREGPLGALVARLRETLGVRVDPAAVRRAVAAGPFRIPGAKPYLERLQLLNPVSDCVQTVIRQCALGRAAVQGDREAVHRMCLDADRQAFMTLIRTNKAAAWLRLRWAAADKGGQFVVLQHRP